jgi:hypothetical protein
VEQYRLENIGNEKMEITSMAPAGTGKTNGFLGYEELRIKNRTMEKPCWRES